MLFHLGALWRLNEAGYLPRLSRISSVSGGSITSAMMGYRWNQLAFDQNGVSTRFQAELVKPIRGLASHTIDIGAVVFGLLRGGVANRIAGYYRRHLFENATLQELPDSPRFVINASNLQSGDLWRFTKRYMRDYRVCEVKDPDVPLAIAVAASSAFPPFLSPLRLSLDPRRVSPGEEPLHKPPYTTRVMLTDGGVYDNLGLETVWKRCTKILVSDGAAHVADEGKPSSNWISLGLRAHNLIDNQVRSLRKRNLIASFDAQERLGTYWGMSTRVADFGSDVRLPCPEEATKLLSHVGTRLARLPDQIQERLINFGYAICDAALRRRVDAGLPDPYGFPYAGGVG
jgi:NTE family protein